MINTQDILGRELKENDLVIGMIVSRDSDGLRFGVFNGTSVNWKTWGIKKSTLRNVYLIENPNEEELKIKQEIIDLVNEIQKKETDKEAERKALKRIPTKDLIIGESYVDDKGYDYVYLGFGSVKWNYCGEEKEGYIYLSWFKDYNKENDCFAYLPDVTVLKNPKKIVKVLDEKLTDYVFDKKEFTLKQPEIRNFYYGRINKSITIKLKEGD